MDLPRLLGLCAGVALAGACRTGGDAAARPGAEEALAERALRRMFPSIEGPVTRASIAADLEREKAVRDPSAGVRAAAAAAIEQGDFDRARDLLGELLAGDQVERARAATAAGDAQAALAALDRALEMAPRSPSILCLRGEAALAAAGVGHDAALLESSLADFRKSAAAEPPAAADLRARAWLGASRAARTLRRLDEAADCARRGLACGAEPGSGREVRARLEALQRALAEASFDRYLGEKSSGAAAAAVEPHAATTRDALESLLGRAPDDAWAWEHLAELAQATGKPSQARELALRGLAFAPDDPALFARLGDAAWAQGGASEAVRALEPLAGARPDSAPAAWQLALAHFDAAGEDALHGRDPDPRLGAAETAAARCRGLDPRREADCRSLEAQCRGARGLARLASGDLEGAHAAFLSMEDATKGGLELEIRGAHATGTDGLFRVAEAYAARGDPSQPGSIESLEQAARICDLLHKVEPRDARFAAAAGRCDRDAAVALELQASALADQGKVAEADRRLAKARELMERALSASSDAVALAPDDERPAAQAGAVLARYLQRDGEEARTFLEKAIALGESKVPRLKSAAEEPGVADAERQARRKLLEDEETLVGDACRDLGLVHLELLGDPAKAREWLERGRRTGPDPRPEIEGLLERCDRALRGVADPKLKDEDRWAAPAKAPRKT